MSDSRKIDQNDLEMITGGAKNADPQEQLMRVTCPYCSDIFQANVQKNIIKCPTCHKTFELKG